MCGKEQYLVCSKDQNTVELIYIHACGCLYIHTYIHTCIHTYVYTYIHTYIHACMHAYTDTDTHKQIHTYIHTYNTHKIYTLTKCIIYGLSKALTILIVLQ